MGRRGEYSAERGIFLRGSVLVLLVRRVVKNIWMAHAIIKPFFIKPYLYISVFKIAMVWITLMMFGGLIHIVFFFRFFEIPFCFPLDFFHSKVLIFFLFVLTGATKCSQKKKTLKSYVVVCRSSWNIFFLLSFLWQQILCVCMYVCFDHQKILHFFHLNKFCF